MSLKVLSAIAHNIDGTIAALETPSGMSKPMPDRQLIHRIAGLGLTLYGYAIYADDDTAAKRVNCITRNARDAGYSDKIMVARRGRVVYMMRAVDPDA